LFALPSIAALIVSPIIAFLVGGTAIVPFNNSPRINSVLNAGGAANPFLWIPGLLLGLLVNWFVLRRTACRVRLVGIACMAYGIFAPLHSYRYQWSGTCSPFDGVMNEFSFEDARRCGGNGTILSAIDFTLPLLINS
jgi:hypothetical protein